MRWVYLAVIILLALATLIFAVQNSQSGYRILPWV